MSLTALQPQQHVVPGDGGSQVKTLRQAAAVHQNYQQIAPPSLNPDAVDPVLLHAKLEVVRLELDAERRAARERKRQGQEAHHAVPAKDISQVGKAFSRRQKELMRRSLPVGAEYMADGKPVYNTAQILAALDSHQDGRGIAHAPNHSGRHDTDRRMKRLSHEPVMAERWASEDSEDDDEEQQQHQATRSKHDSVLFRRSKAEENVSVKLIPTKHGSQTVYERVELQRPGLIEEAETSDSDSADCAAPKPAQQSHNAQHTGLLKQLVHGVKKGGTRPLSALPQLENEPTVQSYNRTAQVALHRRTIHDTLIHDTLITDAVNQIKREQRLKKWHSVQNFLKRGSNA